MQWFLLWIANKDPETVFPLLSSLRNTCTTCVWISGYMFVCSELQLRVETSGPTEVVGVKWGEGGVLSLPLAHCVAPSASLFSCSSVHGCKIQSFWEKDYFCSKPNYLTTYRFMPSVLWTTVALVILIELFIHEKYNFAYMFLIIIWYNSYST